MKTKRSSTGKKRPAKGTKTKPAAKNGTTSNLRRRYELLERECDGLRREIDDVKTERDQFRRSLIAAMLKLSPPGKPPTLEEALAQMGKLPPFLESINQLQAELAAEAKR